MNTILGKRVVLAVFLGMLAGTAHAGSAGTTGAQFLKIPWGARAFALGGAYTGLANDPDAVAWNPAGLVLVNGLQQSFTRALWFEGISVNQAACCVPLGTRSALGVGLEYVSAGDIVRTDRTGRSAGMYQASDMLGGLSYARRIGGAWSVGGSMRWFEQVIEQERSHSLCADLGAMRQWPRLSAGVAVKNIGGSVKFRSAADPLPVTVSAGLAWRWNKRVLVVSDLSLPVDHDASLHAGAEYSLPVINATRVLLRAGIKTDRIADLSDALGGVTAGAGVSRGVWGVDYAVVPYGPLGITHIFTVKLRFSGMPGPAASAGGSSYAGSGAASAGRENVDDMYRLALVWLAEKTQQEQLNAAERIQLLEKIQDKFRPLGADVSAGDEQLRVLKNEVR